MLQTVGRSPRLGYDDLVRLFPSDDGLRHEIIDGVHIVSPAPGIRHQRLVRRLASALDRYLESHPGRGEFFAVPVDVVFTLYDVVEPDLVFIAARQSHIVTEKNVRGAPAIVVEVFSPGTTRRDRTLKRRLFEREGVGEYWMVDPVANTVEVLRRRADGSLPRVAVLTARNQDRLATPLLPGFSIDLARLFE
jgi:Uma2 family endonuclease